MIHFLSHSVDAFKFAWIGSGTRGQFSDVSHDIGSKLCPNDNNIPAPQGLSTYKYVKSDSGTG